MPSALRWVIVTGEFPPMRGGVGDYTAQVAKALAAAGDEVHVIAPPGEGCVAQGVTVHRLPDHYGFRSLVAMHQMLKSIARPRVLLLQYVPHAFGQRNANLPLCAWWASQGSECRAVMFHEVASPIHWRRAFKESVLGNIHRAMATMLVRSAEKMFVSTDAWRPMLRSLGAPSGRVLSLPIPSNLPTAVDDAKLASRRLQLAPAGERLVGSFGSFGTHVAGPTCEALAVVLRGIADVRAVLVGSGARRLAEQYLAASPGDLGRIVTAEDLPADEAAVTIAACDLMIQPYPDGVTTRRSTAMAALALGKPLVTNVGALTESFWKHEAAVFLAADVAEVGSRAKILLQDVSTLRSQGRLAKEFYDDKFSLARTVGIMRAAFAQRR